MVVGDFMLDVYTLGSVRRISPEAPVSILHVSKEERLPGGAGNVILNAISLGLNIVAVGRVGNDEAGKFLLNSLASENVDTRGIFIDPSYQTPIKNRIIADNQQIVRVDYENLKELSCELENKIIDYLPDLLDNVELIACSDYAKGLVTPTLFAAIINIAKEKNIKVIVDPKGKDFTKYKGAFLIKPNLNEAMHAAHADVNTPLEKIASKIIADTEIAQLLITRSKDGMTLFSQNAHQQDFPVDIREVKDVTGAGDTVLAMIIAGLANNWELPKTIQLANIAAGIAVERLGCARITLAELLHRLLEIDSGNKIFGEDHLFTLQEVLKQQNFILLALTSQQGFTTTLFKAIRQCAQKNCILVLYMLDHIDDEFLHLLASLKEISFIILKTDSMYHLCQQIHPQEIYLVDDKQIHLFAHADDLLEFHKLAT